VVFVGAGPGDPELLTLAALRELEEADVILHDRLVPTAILELARPEAERIAVGRRCGEPLRAEPTAIQRMIALARRGSRVVRLKGGDPMLFARAAEELAALEEARIPYRIVPGVTAALACAARAGVPLTWRGRARSVLFATAHDARSIAALGRLGRGRADTLVIYMGRCRLRGLVETLIGAGWPAATPAVAVAGASLPGERVLLSSLAGLPDALSAPADAQPTTLIVGEVAALAARSARRSEATLGESARSAAARAAA
jgi:uroporphyrin-III C-methyltransferase/precorrin-2 dehydrogenase/sirohydrochlorin ferrochelatase